MRKQPTSLLALAILASVLAIASVATAPGASAQATCQGAVDTNIDNAQASFSSTCGNAYDGSSGFHSCEWVGDGWQCQGPGTATAPTPTPAPSPAPQPTATPAPAPAPAPTNTSGGNCVGAVDSNINNAQASFSSTCGNTYNGSSGFHSCEWVGDGWQCEGPGTPTVSDVVPITGRRGGEGNGGPDVERPEPTIGPIDEDDVLTVSTLRELSEAELPEWVQLR